MAQKIRKLDNLTINKIAAGEVIERPASVVKELVENAIDAKSTEITINIHDGGKKLIEVIDNGIGMSYEDALLSIQRHSTSKITSADDLFSIVSLGFRGEALASIVSVAQVELITREQTEELGVHLIVEGGEIISQKRVSTPRGTRIIVKNLFYNVPVRRKFLKSTTTEVNHIIEHVTKLSLAYPKITFLLSHGGKNLISAPKGSLLLQITSIFGKSIGKACIEVEAEEEEYLLRGFITKPEFSRKSKDYIYIFVNGRPISNKIILDAIMQGYGTAIPHGRFPIVFLFLKISPSEIDVNIHPTKKEIRFSREAKVFSLIATSINKALQSEGLKIFERVEQASTQPSLLESMEKRTHQEKKLTQQKYDNSDLTSSFPKEEGFSIEKKIEFSVDRYLQPEKRPIKTDFDARKRSIRVLGIIKDTYIIAETKEGLLLCDQHAAHEKINYIKYLDQLQRKKLAIQELLAPEAVSLKSSEFEIISEIKDQLKMFGFEIDIFGKNEIIIRSVPAIMGTSLSSKIAVDIIDGFKENFLEIKQKASFEDSKFIKDLISMFACRRAIKAGDKITVKEAEKLIDELLSIRDPYTCPHGRPTLIILNEKYIEELFKRDYK
ncbi:MAG: DNA mismatch repair endonuclease MutL [Candidatus Heimdallarchaeaceae archaeon]